MSQTVVGLYDGSQQTKGLKVINTHITTSTLCIPEHCRADVEHVSEAWPEHAITHTLWRPKIEYQDHTLFAVVFEINTGSIDVQPNRTFRGSSSF